MADAGDGFILHIGAGVLHLRRGIKDAARHGADFGRGRKTVMLASHEKRRHRQAGKVKPLARRGKADQRIAVGGGGDGGHGGQKLIPDRFGGIRPGNHLDHGGGEIGGDLARVQGHFARDAEGFALFRPRFGHAGAAARQHQPRQLFRVAHGEGGRDP